MPAPGSLEPSDLFLFERRTVRSGPLPDPHTLRDLIAIYPDAAQVIFNEFREQSAHRRELERLTVQTGATLALRGHVVGGALGGVGLVGSFVIAAFGHD